MVSPAGTPRAKSLGTPVSSVPRADRTKLRGVPWPRNRLIVNESIANSAWRHMSHGRRVKHNAKWLDGVTVPLADRFEQARGRSVDTMSEHVER